MLGTLPAFLLAVVLIWGSPGPAMLLVVRRAAVRGPHAAVATVLGLEVGLYVWAVLAAAGLAALVAASQVAYDVLRVTGAVVLIFLGTQALWRVWRERQASDDDQLVSAAAPTVRRTSSWAAFSEGVVVQLANPKIAVFMLAFYPQFLPAASPVLASTALLALLQVGVETGLYLLLLAGVGRARGWLQLPAVRHRLEAISGTVLIGLGVRVATTTR